MVEVEVVVEVGVGVEVVVEVGVGVGVEVEVEVGVEVEVEVGVVVEVGVEVGDPMTLPSRKIEDGETLAGVVDDFKKSVVVATIEAPTRPPQAPTPKNGDPK